MTDSTFTLLGEPGDLTRGFVYHRADGIGVRGRLAIGEDGTPNLQELTAGGEDIILSAAEINAIPVPEILAAAESRITAELAVPRVKPVRTTIDLAPDLHNQLKVWVATEGVKLAEVWRAMAERLLHDPAAADEIRLRIRESKVR